MWVCIRYLSSWTAKNSHSRKELAFKSEIILRFVVQLRCYYNYFLIAVFNCWDYSGIFFVSRFWKLLENRPFRLNEENYLGCVANRFLIKISTYKFLIKILGISIVKRIFIFLSIFLIVIRQLKFEVTRTFGIQVFLANIPKTVAVHNCLHKFMLTKVGQNKRTKSQFTSLIHLKLIQMTLESRQMSLI